MSFKNQFVFSVFFLSCSSSILFSCNQKTGSPETKEKIKDTTSIRSDSATAQSVYQLGGEWINQNNQSVKLSDLKGKVQIVAMIFSSCKYACPKIVADMKKIVQQIPAAKKNQVGFTLISFDVARDTPTKLKRFSQDMKLDDHWTLLHGDAQQVRELSLLLDVQYEKQDDGSFAHSNVINVLDQSGVIVARQEGIETDPKEMVRKIISLLHS